MNGISRYGWLTIMFVIAVTIIATSWNPASAQGQHQSQGSAPVTIIGPLPVPVQTAVPQPFQGGRNVTMLANNTAAGFPVEVPQNKLVVLQHVSFRVRLPVGQTANATVGCQSNIDPFFPATFGIPLELQGTFNGFSLYVGNSPVTCYSSGSTGNQGIGAQVIRSSGTGDTGLIEFAFSAQMFDSPAAVQ